MHIVFTESCKGQYAYYCATDRLCILGGSWAKCDYYKECPSGDDEADCRKMKKIWCYFVG